VPVNVTCVWRAAAAFAAAALLSLVASAGSAARSPLSATRVRGATAVLVTRQAPWVVVSQPRPRLLRLDARTLKPETATPLGTHPDSSDATAALVWVANTAGDGSPGARLPNTVMSFEARTGRRRRVVRVPGVYRLAAWRDSAWAIATSPSRLLRITSNGRRIRVAAFGAWRPEDVDVAAGRVWVVLSRLTAAGEQTEIRVYAASTGRRLIRTKPPRSAGSVSRIAASAVGAWALADGTVLRFTAEGFVAAQRRIAAVHVRADGSSVLLSAPSGVRRLNAAAETTGFAPTRAAVVSIAVARHSLYVLETNEFVERIRPP